MRHGDQESAPSSPEATFSAALAHEIPRLRRFARVLVRRPDAADDLVQETLMRAMAARTQFALGTNLRAWLFTILRHARAAEARRVARSPLEPGAMVPESPVSGGQEERQAMRDLVAAYRRLPAIQREALWLVVVDGMDYADAATVLGVPQGTLRSRLSRAREALRKGMGLELPDPPRRGGGAGAGIAAELDEGPPAAEPANPAGDDAAPLRLVATPEPEPRRDGMDPSGPAADDRAVQPAPPSRPPDD
jgi:RNA polymerase sigma-70 factor (ECF subfamily)